jgi:hypothetical protein
LCLSGVMFEPNSKPFEGTAATIGHMARYDYNLREPSIDNRARYAAE